MGHRFSFPRADILIIDDEPGFVRIVACALHRLVNVVSAATVAEASELLRKRKFLACTVDLVLRAGHRCEDGMTLLPIIFETQPTAPILVLTARIDMDWVNEIGRLSSERGPPGVTPCHKTEDLGGLWPFILGALRMPAFTIAEAVARLAARFGLTARQVEVLHAKALGKKNAAIAAELRITEDTVEAHLRDVRERMRCDMTLALVWVIAELAGSERPT